MKSQMLYRELAKYYDLVYHNKNYKKEADKVSKIILKYKKSRGKTLLEAGCGTGNYLKHFRKKFSCTGIDISQGMLAVAKKKVKGVVFKKANMLDFNLHRKFDIIVCLFSSIGYVKTYSNLRKTIKNFSLHLKQGGITIIEPWFAKSIFKAGKPLLNCYDGDNIKIARVSISKVRGSVSTLYMRYLIAEKGKPIKYFTEKHVLGLFDVKPTVKIMKEAGLHTKFLKAGLKTGRGLYVGVKI